MIVVTNKDMVTETRTSDMEAAFTDMFKKEIDAYCTYKTWCENTTDSMLEYALQEIMEDEYLHARFLRDYLIEHDMYNLDANDDYEKKFWKIHKWVYK
jgi:hypothetical protein